MTKKDCETETVRVRLQCTLTAFDRKAARRRKPNAGCGCLGGDRGVGQFTGTNRLLVLIVISMHYHCKLQILTHVCLNKEQHQFCGESTCTFQ